MNKQQKELCEAYATTHRLMVEQGHSSDPRKWREVVASLQTGQQPNNEKSGPDCFETEATGETVDCERKSTVGALKGAYTGISWKPTWESQLDYILTKKIKNCKYHYFDHFDKKTGELVESWRMEADTLLELRLPKLKKQWEDRMVKFKSGNPPADPRLSFTLGTGIIKKYGKRIK